MNYYQLLPCNSFCHCESFNSSSWAWVGSVTNDHNLSTKLGLVACISYRISTDIHIAINYQVHYNCFNEPFAVSQDERLYWDMHGLIFETSIWLLAGSTRYQLRQCLCKDALHHTTCVSTHMQDKRPTHSFNVYPHHISTFNPSVVHSMLCPPSYGTQTTPPHRVTDQPNLTPWGA